MLPGALIASESSDTLVGRRILCSGILRTLNLQYLLTFKMCVLFLDPAVPFWDSIQQKSNNTYGIMIKNVYSALFLWNGTGYNLLINRWLNELLCVHTIDQLRPIEFFQ